ncbi:ABC transporter ATP-binding protein [Lactococcus laudensis]|uniref:ABC transporter ATP-binding protein n=1 Tax=Pseudolactococcus laudensis TaxID=1494461 RepID=A0A7V8N091_9LACT|nr:ABC transporter ATP-binding protein [Lactococcus laudensis]MBA0016251.1 ABC transporter ATP-binding protein [Lactococcus laudensis]MBW9280943.1 ABC transporter ATP-binding protein [Lactococcus laudensis]
MLETKNLGFWYQDPANALFMDVNLQFEPGNMYAILGKSGSGKTTFLSLISALESPKEGAILYNSENLDKIGLTRFRRQHLANVFQAYNLLTYMTAYQNVSSALEISGVKKENKRDFITESLKSVAITEDLHHKKVAQLSGGQQQRVAIVRAMITGADIIVADEPTGNLDEETGREMIALFEKIAHEQNKIVILVTHDSDIAKRSDVTYELKDKVFHVRS